MTTYYVGPGGDNGNSGLSWALRKATLNGAEDIPVVAGDTVYVGPGVYRELLLADVSGTAGNPITYIGDVTGENTDGVGGVVRITGSDNDQTAVRSLCIDHSAKNYRTYRGFSMDTTTGSLLRSITSATNFVIEDCYFGVSTSFNLYFEAGATNSIIRRCYFFGSGANTAHIGLSNATEMSDQNILVENCIFTNGYSQGGIYISRIGGIVIKNCTFVGLSRAIRLNTIPSAGQTITVNNCQFVSVNAAFYSPTLGYLVEDYNNLYLVGTARQNVDTGTNSVSYTPVFESPVLRQGYKLPFDITNPSRWSPVRGIAGTSEATEDFYGKTRPTASAKKSWGATQHTPGERETTTTHSASTASIKIPDAGIHQMFLPVSAVSTTITAQVYREANYAGTLPQLIVKQPGQSDQTDTDTGAASQWNELSVTLTPSATPAYVVVELVSNNTATSGSYAVYFDSITVT